MPVIPSIICLHAITRSSLDSSEFAAALEDRFQIFVPDLLGHGEQRRSESYRLSDYRSGLDQTIARAGSDSPLFIYGHSLGGLVAVVLAETLGDRVSGVILEDAPLFEVDWPRFRHGPFYDGFKSLRDRLSVTPIDAIELEAELAVWPSGNGSATFAQHFGRPGVERRTRELLALDPRTLDVPMTGRITAGVDIRRSLARLRCPVVLMAGKRENGSALTESDLYEFSRICSTGTVHRFEDCGHDIRLFESETCRDLIVNLQSGSSVLTGN